MPPPTPAWLYLKSLFLPAAASGSLTGLISFTFCSLYVYLKRQKKKKTTPALNYHRTITLSLWGLACSLLGKGLVETFLNHECICACACVCMFVSIGTHVLLYMNRGRRKTLHVGPCYHLAWNSLLLGCLLPITASCSQASWGSLVALGTLGLQKWLLNLALCRLVGIWTQVLKFAWQVFYSPNRLPRLMLFVSLLNNSICW